MSYKTVIKSEQIYNEVPAHFKMVSACLGAAADVNEGKITFCLSQFLPGGGSDYANQAIETYFYVTEGEIDITLENGVIKLNKGDCFHSGAHTMMGLVNNGKSNAEVIVILRTVQ